MFSSSSFEQVEAEPLDFEDSTFNVSNINTESEMEVESECDNLNSYLTCLNYCDVTSFGGGFENVQSHVTGYTGFSLKSRKT